MELWKAGWLSESVKHRSQTRCAPVSLPGLPCPVLVVSQGTGDTDVSLFVSRLARNTIQIAGNPFTGKKRPDIRRLVVHKIHERRQDTIRDSPSIHLQTPAWFTMSKTPIPLAISAEKTAPAKTPMVEDKLGADGLSWALTAASWPNHASTRAARLGAVVRCDGELV